MQEDSRRIIVDIKAVAKHYGEGEARVDALRNLDQAGAKGNPDQLLPDNPQQMFDTPAQKQAQPAKAVQP